MLLKRINLILKNVEDYVSGSLIVIGLIILLAQVIMRYFLGLSTTWQDESARYFIIWGVLLGSAVALRDGQHIRVDVIYQRFSSKWKGFIDILANICIIVFLMFMAIYGFILVKEKYLTGEMSDIGIKIYVIYSILPLSGLFMGIRAITNLINYKNEQNK